MTTIMNETRDADRLAALFLDIEDVVRVGSHLSEQERRHVLGLAEPERRPQWRPFSAQERRSVQQAGWDE